MLRERFPIFRDKVFINSCSKGALSLEVIDAYKAYLQDWQEKGSPWELWVEKLEALRNAFAGLLNANSHEIGVTTSTSASINAIANSIDFSGERNKVVLTDFAFPTAAQIWHAQTARGAQIVHVPAAGNIIPLQWLEDAIDERTAVVSVSHVCYRNGSRADVEAIIEIAHRKGALVLLDSYQAVGTLPIDVKKLKVDFLVGGTLKYLLGSSGSAFVYVRQELINGMDPSMTGWFAQNNMFAMDIYQHDPSPSARRFEAGTPPNPNVYAALAGVKLVRRIGVEKIEAHLTEITGALKEGAMKRGFSLGSPIHPDQHGAMIAIRSHKVDLLTKWLEDDGIIVSHRDDNLRVSPHFYNTLDDVNRLMDALTKHKEMLI